MTENMNRNVRLVAEGTYEHDWFDIYIDFSGTREYLMPHRPNGRLFSLLKDGVSISELKRNTQKVVSDMSLSGHRYLKGGINPRLKRRKNQARKLENTIGHLVTVVNEYMADMACAA